MIEDGKGMIAKRGREQAETESGDRRWEKSDLMETQIVKAPWSRTDS